MRGTVSSGGHTILKNFRSTCLIKSYTFDLKFVKSLREFLFYFILFSFYGALFPIWEFINLRIELSIVLLVYFMPNTSMTGKATSLEQ